MDDDDLTRGLEAWADATDPGDDAVEGDSVRAPDPAGARAPRRPGRWMVAAAALVVLGAIGAVVIVTTSDADGTDEVVAATTAPDAPPGEEQGTRVQVVVALHAEVDDTAPPEARRFAVTPSCGPRAACVARPELAAGPLRPGTTALVADEHTTAGWITVAYKAAACPTSGCGAPRPDGTRELAGDPLACQVEVQVGGEAERVVVDVVDPPGEPPICTSDPIAGDDPIEEPELTVPPDWSRREPLPWDCGAALWDLGAIEGPADPDEALAALRCVAEAVDDGTAVELPVGEPFDGPGGIAAGARDAVWRVVDGGPDGRPIEVLRAASGRGRPWARLWCTDVALRVLSDDEVAASEDPTPGVAMEEPGVFGVPETTGCTEEEALTFSLPPLPDDGATDGAPAEPPTSRVDPATSTSPPTDPTAADPPPTGDGPIIDVVLDVREFGVCVEGCAHLWEIVGDGEAVLASGPLTELGDQGFGKGPVGSDVLLVADDLAVEANEPVEVRVHSYDCFASEDCLPGGLFPSPEGDAYTTCTATALIPWTGAVLRASLRSDGCEADWLDAVPDLTVPPAWTMRAPLDTTCAALPDSAGSGSVGSGPSWNRCLAEVASAGEGTAEVVRWLDGVVTAYRIDPGGVTVVRHDVLGETATPWTTQTCTGLMSTRPTGVALQDCGPEVPMSLDPP